MLSCQMTLSSFDGGVADDVGSLPSARVRELRHFLRYTGASDRDQHVSCDRQVTLTTPGQKDFVSHHYHSYILAKRLRC